MVWNFFFGMATSAIWKVKYMAWWISFTRILISFSGRVTPSSDVMTTTALSLPCARRFQHNLGQIVAGPTIPHRYGHYGVFGY